MVPIDSIGVCGDVGIGWVPKCAAHLSRRERHRSADLTLKGPLVGLVRHCDGPDVNPADVEHDGLIVALARRYLAEYDLT